MIKQLVTELQLKEFKYQMDFWSSPRFQNPTKPVVLAFGTNGGKSFTSIIHLMLFYMNPENKGKKTIIVPHATTVLRDNIVKSLKKLNPSFSWGVAGSVKELKGVVENNDVIISLPQTLTRGLEHLPKVEWLVVDEAHEWYFANSYKSLLKQINPTYQLLMTGTPFQFNAKSDDFIFHHVSVDELRKAGKAGNPMTKVVSTNFDLGYKEYNKTGNLRTDVDFNKSDNKSALKKVAKEILKNIKNPSPTLVKLNKNTKNILSVFGEVDKSIIIAHNKNMADDFYNTLNGFIPNQVLVSHYENDGDSEEFIKFQESEEHKVLVVVNRGRIGFDMPELFNIIDFSFSTNPSVILQILGRVLRISDLQPDKVKMYYKVAARNTVGYIQDVMTGTLGLTMQEYFTTFTGDFGSIKIPRITRRKRRGGGGTPDNTRKNKKLNTRSISNFMDSGLLDLDFFKEVKVNMSGDFDIKAWATLDDVRRATFGIEKREWGTRTKEMFDKVAKRFTHAYYLKQYDKKLHDAAVNHGWYEYSGLIMSKPTKWQPDVVVKYFKDKGITTKQEAKSHQSPMRFYRQYVKDNIIKDFLTDERGNNITAAHIARAGRGENFTLSKTK